MAIIGQAPIQNAPAQAPNPTGAAQPPMQAAPVRPKPQSAPGKRLPPKKAKGPDGSNPKDMIGYIEPGCSPKIKTYLLAAKAVLLTPQGAQMLRRLLASSKGDPSRPIALLIGKTLEGLQTKLGPLTDTEHDQVGIHIAGWMVSSLQQMGMPGLNTPAGRHDLIGRIMQMLDSMTKAPPGQQGPPQQGPPQQGAPLPPQAPPAPQGPPAPMGQFAGGPGGQGGM